MLMEITRTLFIAFLPLNSLVADSDPQNSNRVHGQDLRSRTSMERHAFTIFMYAANVKQKPMRPLSDGLLALSARNSDRMTFGSSCRPRRLSGISSRMSPTVRSRQQRWLLLTIQFARWSFLRPLSTPREQRPNATRNVCPFGWMRCRAR